MFFVSVVLIVTTTIIIIISALPHSIGLKQQSITCINASSKLASKCQQQCAAIQNTDNHKISTRLGDRRSINSIMRNQQTMSNRQKHDNTTKLQKTLTSTE